jgi:hypothetical protein
LSFDGINDYVGIGNAASLNFTGVITIAAWVKLATASGLRDIVAHGHTLSPNAGVFLRIYAGKYEVGSWNGSNHLTSFSIPSGDVNNWVHLAGTYDGVAWRLYRNGVQVSALNDATGAVAVNANWALGSRGTGTERFFQGSIDEVRIYNRALSAAEIQALVTGATPKRSTSEPDVDSRENLRPQGFHLEQNYPNPFNPTTVIRYNLPEPVHVKLIISDLLGHKIRTLIDEDEPAGYRHTAWDGTNDAGVRVGSGLYLMRFEAGAYRMTRKLMLMK